MSIHRTSPHITEAPQTYAETKGEKPFDWWNFLDRASKGLLEEDDCRSEHREAIERAASWTTCACGNQCSVIPRNNDGSPADSLLRVHGSFFLHYIEDSEWARAFQTLRAIEVRSAELIASIKN